jgi:hypothetical protein
MDYLIAGMLMVTIFYSIKLNRKINELQESKKEIVIIVKAFNEAIVKAEYNISEIKKLTLSSASDLQERIDKAKFLADELAFMTDRGTDIADKLEKSLTTVRTVEAPKIIPTRNGYIGHSNEESLNKMNLDDGARKKSAIEALLDRISSIKKNNASSLEEGKTVAKNYIKSLEDV